MIFIEFLQKKLSILSNGNHSPQRPLSTKEEPIKSGGNWQ